jgi:HPt (histidine-containing phosphotransfer) domain-containing protein
LEWIVNMTELPSAPASPEALDRQALLALVGGNVPLLRELIDVFVAECLATLAEIAAAIQADDASRLRLAAHTLHGTAGTFGHRATCTLARALELRGGSGDLDGAEETFAALTQAVASLERGLLELKSDATS